MAVIKHDWKDISQTGGAPVAGTSQMSAADYNAHATQTNANTQGIIDLGVELESVATDTLAAANAKYTKPNTGIPKTDLAATVQASLASADIATVVVVYDGDLDAARPTAPAVYWRGFPSTPTNALPTDIIPSAGSQLRFLPGTIATAAATAAKTVTLDNGATPAVGDILALTYTSGQTANAATIAINGGAARSVRLGSGSTSQQPHQFGVGSMGLYRVIDGTTLQLLTAQLNFTGDAAASASTGILRDGNANAFADVFVSTANTVVLGSTSAANTMAANSAQVQIYTGTANHTTTFHANAGIGWWWTFMHTGTAGFLTIKSSNNETITTLAAGETAIITTIAGSPSAASGFRVIGGSKVNALSSVIVTQEYNSSAGAISMTGQAIPTVPGKTLVGARVTGIAPGGGGGSGRKGATNTLRTGGGAGGGGAAFYDMFIPASLLTGTWALAIGSGGAGGAAPAANDTDGNPGGAGSTGVYFLSAGGINLAVCSQASGGLAGNLTGAAAGGGNGARGRVAGTSGGASAANGGVGLQGLNNFLGGAAGGGAGGGIGTGNTPGNGGPGGNQYVNDINPGVGGTSAGVAPGVGNAARPGLAGAGAGGGASLTDGTGQNGADAVGYGSGGGGGGASLNGMPGGRGGNGGPGYFKIEWLFQ